MFNVYGVSLFFGVLNFFVVYGEETPGVGLSEALGSGTLRWSVAFTSDSHVWGQARSV